MYLVADNQAEKQIPLKGLLESEQYYRKWLEHPTSSILHHDQICCDKARLWFLSMARSMEGSTSTQFNLRAPIWLTEQFEWGPSIWPISWCELVKEDVIDCGVFAALAREIFQAQGHNVYPAQALLSYDEHCTSHWKDLWKNRMPKKEGQRPGEIFNWVGNKVVYHEVCVVEMPGYRAQIYDATFGSWYEPVSRTGFGALLAVRVECPRLLFWGNKTLSCGEWVNL